MHRTRGRRATVVISRPNVRNAGGFVNRRARPRSDRRAPRRSPAGGPGPRGPAGRVVAARSLISRQQRRVSWTRSGCGAWPPHRTRTGVSVPPVPFDPHPAARAPCPVTRDPQGSRTWPPDPVSGDPDPPAAPVPVARDPHPRRASTTRHYLVSWWRRPGGDDDHGRRGARRRYERRHRERATGDRHGHSEYDEPPPHYALLPSDGRVAVAGNTIPIVAILSFKRRRPCSRFPGGGAIV